MYSTCLTKEGKPTKFVLGRLKFLTQNKKHYPSGVPRRTLFSKSAIAISKYSKKTAAFDRFCLSQGLITIKEGVNKLTGRQAILYKVTKKGEDFYFRYKTF